MTLLTLSAQRHLKSRLSSDDNLKTDKTVKTVIKLSKRLKLSLKQEQEGPIYPAGAGGTHIPSRSSTGMYPAGAVPACTQQEQDLRCYPAGAGPTVLPSGVTQRCYQQSLTSGVTQQSLTSGVTRPAVLPSGVTRPAVLPSGVTQRCYPGGVAGGLPGWCGGRTTRVDIPLPHHGRPLGSPESPRTHRWVHLSMQHTAGTLQHRGWLRDDGALGSILPTQPGWRPLCLSGPLLPVTVPQVGSPYLPGLARVSY